MLVFTQRVGGPFNRYVWCKLKRLLKVDLEIIQRYNGAISELWHGRDCREGATECQASELRWLSTDVRFICWFSS